MNIEDELPRLQGRLLDEVLRQLDATEQQLALQCRIVPLAGIAAQEHYADASALGEARLMFPELAFVARVAPGDFDLAAQRVWGRALARLAADGLAQSHPSFAARNRMPRPVHLALAALVLAGLVACLPLTVLAYGLGLVLSTGFLALTSLRLMALRQVPGPRARQARLPESELPVYSVLVPLFRETQVLPQLLSALLSLDYPAERLDIKLILEEGDTRMRRALARYQLPPQISLVIVPAGHPQTKPRALNYALQFARGSLLTIYDAEDVPEPQQLRLAAFGFAQGPAKLACLQAELAFYNSNENWMARQFTIEYALQFTMLLPALAQAGWPLPLGGTSNHFRVEALRAVGGWDAYNVTEDADLGFRLVRLGYAAGVLDSITYEEACIGLRNWMRQRSRWLKGFMVTWLVHARQPARSWATLGPGGFLVMHASLMGVVLGAVFYPEFLLACAFKAFQPVAATGSWRQIMDFYFLALTPINWGVMMLAGGKALRRKGLHGWWPKLLFMPFYWLLVSLAGHVALWQFLRAPFHWNKTQHGLSRLMQPSA